MARVHCPTICLDKRNPAVRPIEDDLVVTHVCCSNHRTVVLIIEDAETIHATTQLVSVLAWPKVDDDAVAHVQ